MNRRLRLPSHSPLKVQPVSAQEEPELPQTGPPPDWSPVFWRVTTRQESAIEDEGELPEWLRNVEPADPQSLLSASWSPLPRSEPLLPRDRLDARLRYLLAERRASGPLDERELTERVASCRPLDPIPRRKRWHWPRQIQVVFDLEPGLSPILDDQRWLLRRIEGRLGTSLLSTAMVEPGGVWRSVSVSGTRFSHSFPVEGGSLLVLGDLGGLGGGERTKFWRRVGTELRRRRLRGAALSVCPPSRLPSALKLLWRVRYWEGRPSPAAPRTRADRARRTLQLAALLASSARIEPGLLRAVRHVLPADQADIETELDLWMDDRLIGNRSLGIAELAQEVRLELKEHAQTLPLAWRTGAAETIRKWHDGHTEILKAEEMLDAAVEQFRSRSREVFLGLLRYLRDQGPPSSHTPLGGYLIRSEERRCRADWEVDSLPIHAAVWGLCHLAENGIEFDSLLPDGLRLRDIAWILGGRTDARKGLVIHKGNNLHFISANRSDHAQSSGGCVLASFTFRHPDLQIESRGDEGILRQSRMVDDGNPLPLPGRGEVEIESVGTTITLSSSFVPGWATECERTSKGLWVGGNLPVAGGIRVPWPDETLNIGQDPHGVWLDITLSNACTMRLRWIPAGTFRMGSPEEEVGRYDDEVAHNVTITHGFWLGETLCTQVQWRAVMSVRPAEGEGSSAEPSHFKGDDRPVETVTWDECREFCTRLQRRISSLNFRLPTEAEWEYACRAGTETFFSGGLQYAQPTGKDPALDQLGWFAENSENETHPVKGKEVNTWGLFDMHGNVFEWCEDRADWREIAVATDTYEQGIADPLCRVGAWRVVRGGSFLDDAGYCRSASRDARGPGDRDQILGFRLAAGQKEASGAWGPAAEGAAAPGSREATSAAGAHAERARGEGSSPSG